MLRKPKSPYVHERTNFSYKLKRFFDAEAVVIGT